MPGLNYTDLFERFLDLRVLVIGDVMVDAYLFGRVERISPEAPVPVVQVERRVNRLGGAANVALNLKSLGAEPLLCSVIGKDLKGSEFLQLLKDEGMRVDGIIESADRITTTKFRVIGNKAQMLRVDEEVTTDLGASDEAALLHTITRMLDSGRVDAIIFQDYNKGVLVPSLIESVTGLAMRAGIPVAVDPKKKNFLQYRNATLFKPNLKELREGLNIEINPGNLQGLESAAAFFHNEQGNPVIMATLSEKGVFISHQDPGGTTQSRIIPAHLRNIADVSGAGDTVISVAALCLACGVSPFEMAAIANIAGGLVCEEAGVVPVDREKLLNEVHDLL
jgi:D-glycero-beta-D-manno-heptose-7-phosphate kinase